MKFDNNIIENDLLENHNHSWYTELYERNINNLDDVALLYRGNSITYRELFENINKYAKSLKKLGLGKESEIPVCLSNSPEIVYLMGAASMIGAKLNIFGVHFPKEYIVKIINDCNTDILFVEDNNYIKIKDATDCCNVKTIVVNSLSDSLKNGINPYRIIEKYPSLFDSKVDKIKGSDNKVISQSEFVKIGDSYYDNVYENIDMNQDFLITYTSGSTNAKRPKAIVHSSKNFIYTARYHDKDYNGINTKFFTSLAHIPTYSNTNLVSCISDSLMQGAKVGLEPIYGTDSFINSLLIYKPHFVAATKSFWIDLAKKVLFDDQYRNIKFENLILAFSCGESFEINEEKIINKALKKAKAGINITHTPFSIIKMSEAGGDCEHGSIFYSIFRSVQNQLPKNKLKHVSAGMTYFPFVEVAVLDEEGNKLDLNHFGRIVANSPCTMKRYNNDIVATNNFFVVDSEGKKWADMNLYGYLDDMHNVHIYGRITDKELFHPSIISKLILKDTKNIMSCEVVKDAATSCYIAHVEMFPKIGRNYESVLYSAFERCKEIISLLGIDLYFRIRDNQESYPLTKSGKRDINRLKCEGMSKKCVKPLLENGKVILEPFKDNNKVYVKE